MGCFCMRIFSESLILFSISHESLTNLVSLHIENSGLYLSCRDFQQGLVAFDRQQISCFCCSLAESCESPLVFCIVYRKKIV